MHSRLPLGIAAVAILVVGGYWYNEIRNQSTIVSNESAVLIQSQQSGDHSQVTYVKIPRSGFVIVFEADRETGETIILGTSALLSAGEHKDVSVRHHDGLRSRQGATIAAILVLDDGNGVFEESVDNEFLSNEGVPVTTAVVYDGATIDMPYTDEELASLLVDAGYTLSEGVITSPRLP